MSRRAELGWIVVAALVVGGCSDPEPEPPLPPVQRPQTNAVDPAVDNATPPAETGNRPQNNEAGLPPTEGNLGGDRSGADSKTPATEDAPAGPDTPQAEVEEKPTVLGAIGRAVAGAMGVGGDESPGSGDSGVDVAPAYRPKKQ